MLTVVGFGTVFGANVFEGSENGKDMKNEMHEEN